MARSKRGPGWTGQKVALRALGTSQKPDTVAEVWLDRTGHIKTGAGDLLKGWERDGIVGRAKNGRLYPRDGQRFLDELPYMYKSPYLWAEPVR
jgi:hypothetical protein